MPYLDESKRKNPPVRNPRNAEIRAWGIAHGYDVGEKGPVPEMVMLRYEAAMAKKAREEAKAQRKAQADVEIR